MEKEKKRKHLVPADLPTKLREEVVSVLYLPPARAGSILSARGAGHLRGEERGGEGVFERERNSYWGLPTAPATGQGHTGPAYC